VFLIYSVGETTPGSGVGTGSGCGTWSPVPGSGVGSGDTPGLVIAGSGVRTGFCCTGTTTDEPFNNISN
jgi:hypothetical protein